jgi:hypothetical protein
MSGGPVGFRILSRNPDWLEWLIIQNANAYEVGLTAAWEGLRNALWKNRTPETEKPILGFLELDTIKSVCLTNVALYPKWQEFLHSRQPKAIIFWGQDDIFFTREGGDAYLNELPRAEMHRLDSPRLHLRAHAPLLPRCRSAVRNRILVDCWALLPGNESSGPHVLSLVSRSPKPVQASATSASLVSRCLAVFWP